MSYLTELPFVEILDCDGNAFFWSLKNPLSYIEGQENANCFIAFLEKYPFMNNSNLLYRIGCDMSDSGLIKSESARGFYNTLDTIITSVKPPVKVKRKYQKKTLFTLSDVAKSLSVSKLSHIEFLCNICWLDTNTLGPTEDAISTELLRKSETVLFGFVFTKKGIDLISQKYKIVYK